MIDLRKHFLVARSFKCTERKLHTIPISALYVISVKRLFQNAVRKLIGLLDSVTFHSKHILIGIIRELSKSNSCVDVLGCVDCNLMLHRVFVSRLSCVPFSLR